MNLHEQLQTLTDMTALKAMAYDAIAAKEEAERNLDQINNRIRQVMMGQATTAAPAAPTAANGGSVDETQQGSDATPPAGNDNGAAAASFSDGSDGSQPSQGQ